MVNKSLFHVAGSLPPGYEHYVYRDADDRAYEYMSAGTPVSIFESRQTGKSSLLRRLQRRLNGEGWACAYIDLTILHNETCDQWIRHIVEEIETAGNLARSTTFPRDPWQFDQYLRVRFGEPSSDLKLALLLDEVEVFADVDFAVELFIHIRTLYQTFKQEGPPRRCLALSGQHAPASLTRHRDISPLNIVIGLALEDYTDTQCRALTAILDRNGDPLAPEVHEQIYFWTGGHPYLVQRLCTELERKLHTGSGATLNRDAVAATVESVFLTQPDLDANMTHVRKAIGRLTGPAAALWEKLLLTGTIKATDVGSIALQDTGVLRKDPTTRCSTWRNPIYEWVMRECGPIPPDDDAVPRMSLDQIKELQAYLVGAFGQGELEQLAYYGLGVRLGSIAVGNLNEVAFGLITWAQERGQLAKLIQCAREARPFKLPPF